MTVKWTRFLATVVFVISACLSFFQKPFSAMIFFQLGLYLSLVALIYERT